MSELAIQRLEYIRHSFCNMTGEYWKCESSLATIADLWQIYRCNAQLLNKLKENAKHVRFSVIIFQPFLGLVLLKASPQLTSYSVLKRFEKQINILILLNSSISFNESLKIELFWIIHFSELLISTRTSLLITAIIEKCINPL